MESVVDKVALGQVLSEYLGFLNNATSLSSFYCYS